MAFRAAVVGAGLLLALVGGLGLSRRAPPARCGPGYEAHGDRCCAEGQAKTTLGCGGPRTRCIASVEIPGCAAPQTPVPIAGVDMQLRFNDWQSEGVVPEQRLVVEAFQMDNTEVTFDNYRRCVDAARCEEVAFETSEGDLPITQVDPAQAERYCRWRGGHLPTRDEWTAAAAGPNGLKYPWGPTGLVCRRAVYGLLVGPCHFGGDGPDAVATRAAGTTASGLYDMAGNVAEWALDGTHYVAMGGSYLSTLASQLATWSAEVDVHRSAHVGFRCAYSIRSATTEE